MLVVILSQADLVKGILSALLGLGIATVGFAPIGATPRFSFGVIDLMAGVGIVPFMVGLFAISQILRDVTEPSIQVRPNFNIRGPGVRWSEFAGHIRNMLRSISETRGVGQEWVSTVGTRWSPNQ